MGSSLGVDDEDICVGSIGDPELGAVQQVAPPVRLQLGSQLHADHVRARVRFTHRQCTHVFAYKGKGGGCSNRLFLVGAFL